MINHIDHIGTTCLHMSWTSPRWYLCLGPTMCIWETIKTKHSLSTSLCVDTGPEALDREGRTGRTWPVSSEPPQRKRSRRRGQSGSWQTWTSRRLQRYLNQTTHNLPDWSRSTQKIVASCLQKKGLSTTWLGRSGEQTGALHISQAARRYATTSPHSPKGYLLLYWDMDWRWVGHS